MDKLVCFYYDVVEFFPLFPKFVNGWLSFKNVIPVREEYGYRYGLLFTDRSLDEVRAITKEKRFNLLGEFEEFGDLLHIDGGFYEWLWFRLSNSGIASVDEDGV